MPARSPALLHILSPDQERVLREMNPWWRGEPVPRVPPTRRWPFNSLLHQVQEGPASFVLLRGPRQVGKTVLQLQVIQELLHQGVAPQRILRVQVDDLPALRQEHGRKRSLILDLAYWFAENILRSTLTAAANAGAPALLFLDEAQNPA